MDRSNREHQNGGMEMKIVNLRDYYPFYTSDCFVEVPDDIADVFITFNQYEAAYQARKYYHKAQYTLDRGDGIEDAILRKEPSAEDTYEHESVITQIVAAISALPQKQAQRIYACYFEGISEAAIAKAEGVSKQVISASIRDGLRNIRKILESPQNDVD